MTTSGRPRAEDPSPPSAIPDRILDQMTAELRDAEGFGAERAAALRGLLGRDRLPGVAELPKALEREDGRFCARAPAKFMRAPWFPE